MLDVSVLHNRFPQLPPDLSRALILTQSSRLRELDLSWGTTSMTAVDTAVLVSSDAHTILFGDTECMRICILTHAAIQPRC